MRWRVRQDSNLQHPDLESGALPIGATDPPYLGYTLTSRCRVWDRQEAQNFLSDSFSVVVFRFFVLV